jgi:putative heme-binding domain-containing protein
LSGPLAAQEVRPLQPLPKFLRTAVIAERYLSTRKIDEVLRFERVEPVCLQLVKRPHVPRHARVEALSKLAEIHGTDGATELLPWIEYWDLHSATTATSAAAHRDSSATLTDEDRQSVLSDLAGLLAEQSRGTLEQQRSRLVTLASNGTQPATRQGALVALIQADASPDAAWQLAAAREGGLLDLLQGLTWLPSDAPRAALYQKLRPLLQETTPLNVRRAAIESIGTLGVEPRETFDTLAGFVTQGVFPEACVASICNISSEFWTDELRLPLARGLLQQLAAKPLAERSTPSARQTIKLIKTIAELLPSDESARLLRDVESISVKEIRLHTLEEKMAYDQTVLVVKAGQGIQVTLVNDDIMPHNLVLVDSPAAREEVGIAADRMQNEPDALARGYLPDSTHILQATRLLYPKQTDVLTFSAPQTPGVYAYLCTFPGHWSKMYGALVVAADPAAYLAANNPLPSADALLGIRTVSWTYELLVAELPKLQGHRSFDNGQKNFLKASCFACHQVDQQGGRIGPELTSIRDKYKSPAELLRQIMMPSEKVEEKYATVVVETSDGQVIRGVLLSETDSEVQVSENPLVSCTPRVVRKDHVESLTRSQLSPMPEQLLNTLIDTNDVLDLLAYIMAAGNPQDPLYQ